jgi:hypothetical protein
MSTATQPHPVMGGWTAYGPITPADQKVFNEAIKSILGVKYTPQKVATQLVAGTNYRFKCIASMPPTEVLWDAIVEIYAPLKGEPYVTGIIRV